MTGAQIIAIKLGEHGVRDRGARLRIVGDVVGHQVESSSDLTPDEIRTVIGYLEALPEGAELLPPADPVPAKPPTDDRPTSVTAPEEWEADRWREFLKARKVKVAPAIKEAQRLGAELDPPIGIAMLDDLAGSGVCSDLVGWIEEQA